MSALYKTRQICTKNIQSTVIKSTCKRLKTYNPGFEETKYNENA